MTNHHGLVVETPVVQWTNADRRTASGMMDRAGATGKYLENDGWAH